MIYPIIIYGAVCDECGREFAYNYIMPQILEQLKKREWTIEPDGNIYCCNCNGSEE